MIHYTFLREQLCFVQGLRLKCEERKRELDKEEFSYYRSDMGLGYSVVRFVCLGGRWMRYSLALREETEIATYAPAIEKAQKSVPRMG